jgi:orotate phosphoribosyltransferase
MHQTAFSSETSARVAGALVQLGALRITTGQPFVYTSGWASPIYIDTRLIMSDVGLRQVVMSIAARQLADIVAAKAINAVVGAESSGIAFAAWLAERLALPLLYQRKRPLGWGSAARLEGKLPEDARVLYVDDVTTDARSKVAAVSALRQSGAAVADALVIVNYGIYPHTDTLLAENALTLHALTQWRDLFVALKDDGGLSDEAERVLTAFGADPVTWSVAHGGVGA